MSKYIKLEDATKQVQEVFKKMLFGSFESVQARVKEEMEKMPSIDIDDWTPVSEGLPEDDKEVLVTVHFLGLDMKSPTGWNDHIKPSTYVETARYMGGEWYSDSDEYKVARNRHRVIAWKPLPKPYEESEGE